MKVGELMGEVFDMVMTISKNNKENKKKDELRNKVINDVINQIIKTAKTSNSLHFICDDESIQFHCAIMTFLLKEGFQIDNFIPKAMNAEGQVIKYPEFDILWNQ